MPRAGLRRWRLQLQSQAAPTPPDPTSGAWTTQATVWGEKLDQRATEAFAGKQFLSTATAAFRIPYRSDITSLWRVLENGVDYWRVVGKLEPNGRRTESVLLVERFEPNDRAA